MGTRIENSINMPSNKKFGLLMVAVFSVGFGYFQWKYSQEWAIVSLFLAILFALMTMCVPALLAPLNKAWFSLGMLMGKVISPFILSFIFFILIVPVALTTRLFGRDILLLKKRQVFSYWVDKDPIEPDSFKNQF